jgi:prephenate dehydrogenase
MAVATVIGGAGRMGGWFANFLKKNGYRIIICDKNKRKATNLARKKGFIFLEDPKLAVQPAQLVIMSTPTHISKKLLLEIEPHLANKTVLVEISSIKEPIRRTIQRMKERGATVLSIHPMFGPGTKNLAGKTVITALVPRHNRTANDFISLFKKKGARIIKSNLAQHDRLVSITLALPHFMNIAMAQTLKLHGFAPGKLRAAGGTTFKLQLTIAEDVYQESFSNEASILMDNMHSLKVLKTFLKQSNRNLSMITSGARTGLIQELKKGRNYLRRDEMFSTADGRFNAAVEASNVDLPHQTGFFPRTRGIAPARRQ